MNGSHSQPLMTSTSLGMAGFCSTLTRVGNPAPPIPTRPATLTAPQICSALNGSTLKADVNFSKTGLAGVTASASVSMIIAITRPTAGWDCRAMSLTVPATGE